MGELKVTDRRMFTPDGRLRESFERELAETEAAPSEPEIAAAPPEPPPEAPPVSPAPVAAAAGTAGLPALPADPPAGMLELVDYLAQLALASMGEVAFADGRLARDLDAARFYIDLIASFHERYALRLSAQETRFLESYLDQLRLRYVAHSG
jgi:hypothetical protein